MPDKPEREDSEPKIRDKTPRSWYKLCGFLSPLRFTGQGSGLCYTAKSEAINRIFTETGFVKLIWGCTSKHVMLFTCLSYLL